MYTGAYNVTYVTILWIYVMSFLNNQNSIWKDFLFDTLLHAFTNAYKQTQIKLNHRKLQCAWTDVFLGENIKTHTYTHTYIYIYIYICKDGPHRALSTQVRKFAGCYISRNVIALLKNWALKVTYMYKKHVKIPSLTLRMSIPYG